jgi:hypothetical protein
MRRLVAGISGGQTRFSGQRRNCFIEFIRIIDALQQAIPACLVCKNDPGVLDVQDLTTRTQEVYTLIAH